MLWAVCIGGKGVVFRSYRRALVLWASACLRMPWRERGLQGVSAALPAGHRRRLVHPPLPAAGPPCTPARRDGTRMLLTPESSVEAQKKLGADIIIPLDELPPYHTEQVGCHRAAQRPRQGAASLAGGVWWQQGAACR